MRKIAQIFSVLLLTGACILNSGCDREQMQRDTVVCLGNVVIDGVASVVTEDWGILVNIPKECLPVVADAFTSPNPSSNKSNSSSVALSEASPEGVAEISGSHCMTLPSWLPALNVSVSLTVFIRPVMIVGPEASQSKFFSKPSGTSDNELVAQSLWKQYGSTLSSIASLSTHIVVHPHTKVILHLEGKQKYKYGVADLKRNGTDTYLPWLFTDGSQLTGELTPENQNC